MKLPFKSLPLRAFSPSFSVRGLHREKITGKTLLFLAGIVLCFTILQLALRHYEPAMRRDSVAILERVTVWHKTNIYVSPGNAGSFVPPFALYCFRLPLWLNIPLEPSICAMLLVLGMSVPLLFFLLVRELVGDDRIALVAAAIMATNPYLHDVFNAILRDPVFIPLVLLAGYLVLRCCQCPDLTWDAPAAGGVSALALLTRYEGIMLPAAFLFLLVLASWKNCSWKVFALKTICFLLAWGAVMVFFFRIWQLDPAVWRVIRWRFSVLWS